MPQTDADLLRLAADYLDRAIAALEQFAGAAPMATNEDIVVIDGSKVAYALRQLVDSTGYTAAF